MFMVTSCLIHVHWRARGGFYLTEELYLQLELYFKLVGLQNFPLQHDVMFTTLETVAFTGIKLHCVLAVRTMNITRILTYTAIKGTLFLNNTTFQKYVIYLISVSKLQTSNLQTRNKLKPGLTQQISKIQVC